MSINPKKIAVIGSGYVGLVTGTGLAMNGYSVTCIDNNREKVSLINQGICPICEPGLDEPLFSCVKKQRTLKATEDFNVITDSNITFICVSTFSETSKKTDFKNIIHVAKKIGTVLQHIKNYHLIVVKSTVFPGTTEEIIIPTLTKYSSKKAGPNFGITINPEFLQEGNALKCFQEPDRIIIGEYDRKAGDMLEGIYRELWQQHPIIRTSIKTAEMIKYASNAYLSTKISFINEIGNLCKKLGIDVYEVANSMGYDPRIGNRFLNAGLGFGGSCLPKDLEELISRAQHMGYEPDLLKSVQEVNSKQPLILVAITEKKLGTISGKVTAVLGLSFKPNTDDIRESLSIKIINRLVEKGAKVKVYDPRVTTAQAKTALPSGASFCTTLQDAIDGSDAVLITTEWDEFNDEGLYTGKMVIDGRRVLIPEKARAVCDYEGICW